MKLSAAVQKTYPRCTHYIRNLLPQVGQLDVVVKAMEKYGQPSPSQFRVAISWGTWPDLQVVPLQNAYGGFDKTTPDIIKIDPFVVQPCWE
ncbi:hypothetical protein [Nannocystis sp. SCPEA4]|uniref:hypothetical protein n=1 Tax=Nannocystis sp. SCPEA4 TaxID=2996787 RepID=UPI00226E93F4|nr:hypothetical protein [Nannocystis sp. SCPEA4]MCY1060091.1 hypothetical protein [Nannocystis sp. SCPEA4]